MTTIPQQQPRGSADERKPLGELDRLSVRMRIGVCGLLFMLIGIVLVWIHRLGGSQPVVISDGFFERIARMAVLAAVVTPALYWGLQRLLRANLPIGTCRGYRQLLIAPFIVSAVALPLIFVQAVWPEALSFIAANTALAAPGLLAYSWLRRFPPDARIVEAKDHIEVHPRG